MNDAVDTLRGELVVVNPEFTGMKTGLLGWITDTQEYNLAADFGKMDYVTVTDRGGPPYPKLGEIQYWQKDLAQRPEYSAIEFIAGKGEPQYYYIYGDAAAPTALKIGFVPVPNRTASFNVTYGYRNIETALVALSESPALPADWHPLIAVAMCVLAATTDNNPNLPVYAKMYDSRLERRLVEATAGRGEAMEVIEMVEGFLPFLLPGTVLFEVLRRAIGG